MNKKKQYFYEKKQKKTEADYKIYLPGKIPIINADELLENGIFRIGTKYSAIIKISEVKEGEVFLYMREREVDFRLLSIKEDKYIYLSGTEQLEEFQQLIKLLMGELRSRQIVGGKIELLNLTERFRLMHGISLLGMEKQSLNYTEYILSAAEWKKDICDLETYDFQEKKNVEVIKGQNCFLAIVCVQAYPEDIDAIKRINSMICNHEKTEISLRILQPITDYCVIRNVKRNYMGLDSVMVSMKKEDPEFYQLYQNEKKEDTGRYSFVGTLALISADTEEELLNILKELESYTKQYSGRLLTLKADKMKAYKNLMFDRCDDDYTRIMYSDMLQGLDASYSSEVLKKSENTSALSQFIKI